MEVIIKIIMKINLLNISLHCHRSSVTWAMTSKSIVINISSMQCIRMIKFGISSGEGSTIRSVLVLACASGRTSGSPNSSQWRIQDLVYYYSYFSLIFVYSISQEWIIQWPCNFSWSCGMASTCSKFLFIVISHPWRHLWRHKSKSIFINILSMQWIQIIKFGRHQVQVKGQLSAVFARARAS